MNDEELFHELRRIVPPDPDPVVRERAKLRALMALGQKAEEPTRGRFHWPAWSFAVSAAAAVAMLALKWHSHFQPPPSTSADSVALLAQMERTFPGELDAVIERDGQFKVALASQPSTDSDQPVLVEFRRGPSLVRVLSFSGRHVCVDLDGAHACFEALIDARGRVIVDGEDFVAQGNFSGSVHGWKVAAQSLPHS